ncbi:tetratricopeptide repeat protein [Ferrovum sp. PN-J185]|uniref:tetratricopeptide repeat protein n=1 Tax=Ferrovum sp. PN-J185 TaxID=1356306 RepID=UPI001E3B7CA3|nr:tetratricopeptide repeat protein [Ferrovum sp. PN-J185]MCC6068619.1 tetratricopeptide repeat protein [Ferrovum sp. PN-J185]
MSRYKKFFFYVSFLSILAFSFNVNANPIDNLRSLVHQKRFDEAFDLGLSHEQLIGNPKFDYYFAIAAIDSGHAAIGITTLERLLAIYPENDKARLELARAYFLTENYEKAKLEFNKILEKKIPHKLKTTIKRYLFDIDQHDPVTRTTKSGYLNIMVGQNTNSITETLGSMDSSWLYNVISPVYSSSVYGTQSSYLDGSVGYLLSSHLTSSWRYIIDLNGNYRNYTLNNYDQRSTSTVFGLANTRDDNEFTILSNISQDGLNGGDLRSVYSIKTGWNKNLNRNTVLKSSITYSMLRYNNTLSPTFNSNMPVISIGASQWVGGKHGLKFDIEMSGAQERNLQAQNSLSRNILGGKMGVASIIHGNLTSYLSAGYYKSNYWTSQINPLLANQIRQDRLLTLDLSLKLKLDRSFSIVGNLSRISNNSEYISSVFAQNEYGVGVSYSW